MIDCCVVLYTQDRETEAKLSDILSALSATCSCSLSVQSRVFTCPDTANSQTAVFLGELSYVALPEVDVPSLLTSWVSSGPAITVNSIQLQVDTSCPVVIESLKSERCPDPPTTGMPTDMTVIAAAAGGGVLPFAVIIIVVIVAASCGKRSKHRYLHTNTTTILIDCQLLDNSCSVT